MTIVGSGLVGASWVPEAGVPMLWIGAPLAVGGAVLVGLASGPGRAHRRLARVRVAPMIGATRFGLVGRF